LYFYRLIFVNSLRSTHRQYLLAVFFLLGSPAQAVEPAPTTSSSASQQKLQRILEQARQRAANPASAVSGTALGNVLSDALPSASATAVGTLPSPARMQERSRLLAQGEAALARSDTDTAQTAFESAANILHAADTEMGIVRTYMQQGHYRQALAFGAHTAGAHLDVVGGAALYAWLLHIGGQPAFAQRLMAQAQARTHQQMPLLREVQSQLQSHTPLASGALLKTPVRMAPYGPVVGLPSKASVRGSGTLIDQGARAIVPLALVASPTRRIWLRNGLGQLSPAKLERQVPQLRIAVLQLTQPMPLPEPTILAPSDAFPGAVVMAVEYVPARNATPRWPLLSSGFLGPAQPSGPARQLGISLPSGPRGGPVFDDGGRLIGVAVGSGKGADQLVLTSQLHSLLGHQLGTLAVPGPRSKVGADLVYERALGSTLQVLIAP
jgi:hypothetical protein